MKIDTAEKYSERFKRIGAKGRRKWAKDCMRANFIRTEEALGRRIPDVNRGLKPNHGARAVSLNDVYANAFKSKKSKEWFPNVGGIRIVGSMGSCDRTLVAWSEEVNDADKPWKTEYHAFAYPCTVDHGWEKQPDVRRRWEPTSLRRATGKPGEHRDSLGRTW